jgi:hypothetical protein
MKTTGLIKSTGLKLVTVSIFAIELGGCLSLGTMHEKLTSMNVGCSTEGMKISKERVALNGNETWTATCNGKTYDCDYFPDAGSNCYLREE